MKTRWLAALFFASTLAPGTASAQPFPFNQAGVTNGHWHLNSKDVAANEKIFVDLKAFIKTLEANNVKLDRPYTVNEAGVGLTFITDPWGTYIEINERPPQ